MWLRYEIRSGVLNSNPLAKQSVIVGQKNPYGKSVRYAPFVFFLLQGHPLSATRDGSELPYILLCNIKGRVASSIHRIIGSLARSEPET